MNIVFYDVQPGIHNRNISTIDNLIIPSQKLEWYLG